MNLAGGSATDLKASPIVRDCTVGVIGVGALGGVICDVLARCGVRNLLIVDGDVLVSGNIVRHTLTLEEVGLAKVQGLRRRIEQVSPATFVRSHEGPLPTSILELQALLEPCHIIIDCSADDGVAELLGRSWWPLPKHFFSFSVGYRAEKLFAFVSRAHQFPAREFLLAMAPAVAAESARLAEDSELVEGAGCWSPLFPARLDDLLIAAATCVKIVEESVAVPAARLSSRLVVFEQVKSGDGFAGFRRTDAHSPQMGPGR
jgi:hypothetical protein